VKKIMYEFINKYFKLNRTAVSDDTNRLAEDICSILNARSIDINSGEECLTWVVPKHWKVREAYLADANGKKVVDFKDNPLHLWTHSISFKGEVKRDELEGHLFSDPKRPSWVPYHYRNGYSYESNDWGFSLSHNVHQNLKDDTYVANIDADLDDHGCMKVVDFHVKGSSEGTFLFAAHTCHPAQVADGLSNVAVLVEFFKKLKCRTSLKYSYRLVLGPEYFAAAGFLEKVPAEEISHIKATLYLDMLGNNMPFVYQHSFQGDSILDRVMDNVFANHVKGGKELSYRGLWGNDEMFYNGCGFRIPSLGFACDMNNEYHYDADNPDMINVHQLEESVGILERIVDVLEDDYIPVPQFKGPLYLSRYGLYIDPKEDQKGYDNLEYIQILMDGKRSCLDIATDLNIDFSFVKKFCDTLLSKGLIIVGSSRISNNS